MSVVQQRCPWPGSDAAYIAYHDTEWGVPLHNETRLFEMLILEGAQAGLSWLTILKRRDGYRRAFDNFDAERIARYDEAKIAALLTDTGIIRNRLKVRAAVTNAQATLTLREERGGLAPYFWQFVEGTPIQNNWKDMSQVPATTPLSDRLSKDLKSRGFRFVGSTIMYAFMQSIGMVNDHLAECFRHRELSR